jgi:hypothetical protein
MFDRGLATGQEEAMEAAKHRARKQDCLRLWLRILAAGLAHQIGRGRAVRRRQVIQRGFDYLLWQNANGRMDSFWQAFRGCARPAVDRMRLVTRLLERPERVASCCDVSCLHRLTDFTLPTFSLNRCHAPFHANLDVETVMRVMGSAMAIGADADDIVEPVCAFIRELRYVMRFQVRLAVVSAERGRVYAKLAAAIGSLEGVHPDGLYALALNYSRFGCRGPR